MSYDAIIKEMRERPIDVCYTHILVGLSDHRFPWEAKFQSRSWAKLISQPQFQPFAKTANAIYKEMDRWRQHFPTVIFANKQLELIYRQGDGKIKWVVDEDGNFRFSIFHFDELLQVDLIKLEVIAEFASCFLNGDIAFLKGNYVVSN